MVLIERVVFVEGGRGEVLRRGEEETGGSGRCSGEECRADV